MTTFTVFSRMGPTTTASSTGFFAIAARKLANFFPRRYCESRDRLMMGHHPEFLRRLTAEMCLFRQQCDP
jgi:hypothetical protein